MVVATASEFRTAVREYRFDSFALEGDAIDAARASVAEAGLIVVGEPHGMYETPAVVSSLAVTLGTRAVAFALLQRLRAESRLEQVIAFDRLDPVPHPEDWRIRDREMAERLLTEWQRSAPLLVMTGAFHAAMQP